MITIKHSILILFISLLSIFFVIAKNQAYASNWQKYSISPILSLGTAGSWDSNEIRDPYVNKISGQYRMWYTGGNGDYNNNTLKIGYATSSDGIHWTKYPNPVVNLQDSHTNVSSPSVVVDNNIYKMWIEIDNNENNIHEFEYAASLDGIHWTSPISINLLRENWNSSALAHPEVFKSNNIFEMVYSGSDSNTFNIGLAKSDDGITWINSSLNPVFQSNSLENFLVSAPSIIEDSNTYKMFYSSNFPTGIINLATSTNLDSWTRSNNNPLLQPTNLAFDENSIGSPSVLKDGNEYKMYYSGLDNNGHWQIGLATASADISLNVPLLKQTQNPWQSQEYDSAHIWSPQNKTINTWGCTLTSAAMILQYYGINKLPDGTTMNPGSLNTWLKTYHGYDDGVNNGYLLPQAISQLSHLAKSVNNITAFDGLETQIVQTSDIQQATNDLQHNQPIILGVNNDSHYVVATGTTDNTLTINDPYYPRTTLADGYNNTFRDMTRYTPSFTDLSYIVITAPQNVTIALTDNNHNSVGMSEIQPSLINDETGISSGDGSQIIFFQKPASGNYTLTVSSNQTKTYRINIYEYDTTGKLSFHDKEGSLSINGTNSVQLIFDKTNATNSQANKTVTFQTLLDDITSLKTLGEIKRNADIALINATLQAQKNASKGNILVEKIQLQTLLQLINAEHPNLITNTALQILQEDIFSLQTHS